MPLGRSSHSLAWFRLTLACAVGGGRAASGLQVPPSPRRFHCQNGTSKLRRCLCWGRAKSRARGADPSSFPRAVLWPATCCSLCCAIRSVSWERGTDAGLGCHFCCVHHFGPCVLLSSLESKGIYTQAELPCRLPSCICLVRVKGRVPVRELQMSQGLGGWHPCADAVGASVDPLPLFSLAAEQHGVGSSRHHCGSLLAGTPSRPGRRLAGWPQAQVSASGPHQTRVKQKQLPAGGCPPRCRGWGWLCWPGAQGAPWYVAPWGFVPFCMGSVALFSAVTNLKKTKV